MKRNLRITLIVFAIAMMLADFILIDYQEPSWSNNTGFYINIIAMVGVLLSIFMSTIRDRKQQLSVKASKVNN